MAVDATVALVTLAQAKTWLKIASGTTSEDTLLETMINRAGALANRFTGRTLKSADYVEFYDGTGTSKLMLRRYPVTAVSSIYDDVTRAWAAASLIDSDEIIIDSAGVIQLDPAEGTIFTRGRLNIKISYTAGYKDTDDANRVPYDLQEAALLILQHSYKRHYETQRIGLNSETVGDKTMTYSDDAIPKKAKAILELYRYYPGVS
jgi:uncharacterized phiE125 gp8 family phage protein